MSTRTSTTPPADLLLRLVVIVGVVSLVGLAVGCGTEATPRAGRGGNEGRRAEAVMAPDAIPVEVATVARALLSELYSTSATLRVAR